jgi:hypothetical protein
MTITADEARRLAAPSAFDEVDKVYHLIREAAGRGEFSICLQSIFWSYDNDNQRIACDILYKAGFGTEYRSKFPNVWESYTIVSW